MIRGENGRGAARPITSGPYNDQTVEYFANRLIVQLAAREETTEVDAATRDVLSALPEGSIVLRGPTPTGRLVIKLPPAQQDADPVSSNMDAASSIGAVAYAEPDVVDRAQIVPNDVRYTDQWAPPKVRADLAWDLETGASNVIIGIIDSGISMSATGLDHDDLNTASRITLGTDFIDGGTPRDENGHGTHVAGIAAAAGNNSAGVAGMNWQSPLYVCRTLDKDGNGSSADFADAVEEITDYALANQLRAVINYSGGGADNLTKRQACEYASDRGMLVVAATGNDNGGPVIFPAAYSTVVAGVVAVGSTDENDAVSNFSNVGPEVTVVAPGRGILSTLPTYSVDPTLPLNYGELSGTSMATPLVSGLASLMWSRHPSHSNAKIKQCLQDSAVKLGNGDFDNNWGHGRVDARAAVTCGDLIVTPSIVGSCPSTITICAPPSRLCPSTITICAPPSRLCPSTITICAPPSRLCPSTIQFCPSRLPVLCPTTRLATCAPSTLTCPSAIDACPSTLACPSVMCSPPVDARAELATDAATTLADLSERVAALEARFEGHIAASASGAGSAAEADWYYVDDQGVVHTV